MTSLKTPTVEQQDRTNVRKAEVAIENAIESLGKAKETLRFALSHAQTGHSDIAGSLNGLEQFVRSELVRRENWLKACKEHQTGDVADAKHAVEAGKSALVEVQTLRGTGYVWSR